MKKIKSCVTAPLGFKALGLHCGIKKKNKDLGLLYSEVASSCKAFFTTNALTSCHIQLDKVHLSKTRGIKAIVVNSGNANCCTGQKGFGDSISMAKETAKVLGVKPQEVLVASTGVIGQRLPIEKIKKTISKFPGLLSKKGAGDFAHSIMTTDTKPKEVAVAINISGKTVKIAGAAKGAGMIDPLMATTLMFITTDAAINKAALDKSGKSALEGSLNAITVDGDMSPNDSLFILANGLAKNKVIKPDSKDFKIFTKALKFVCTELAKLLVKDAEGATKFIAIYIKGANSKKGAKKISCAIANSLLFKTMMHGADPNWGRIVSSAGSVSSKLDIKKLDVYIGPKKVYSQGLPTQADAKALRKILLKKEVKITLDLRNGKYESFKYTCDLSPEYIKINSKYRT